MLEHHSFVRAAGCCHNQFLPLARLQVRAVKLRRDRIVVALEHKVLIYNFADLRLLHSIETQSNPAGLLALSAAAEQTVLACPGLHNGQVGVRRLQGPPIQLVHGASYSEEGVGLPVFPQLPGRLLLQANTAQGTWQGKGTPPFSQQGGLSRATSRCINESLSSLRAACPALRALKYSRLWEVPGQAPLSGCHGPGLQPLPNPALPCQH